MAEKLNTTNIPKSGTGVAKTLQPGNLTCKVLSVELKPFTFKEGAYELLLNMEGPDMGPDFVGFFIDKTNESLGRSKGQVGRVKATEWAFADSTTKSGVKISRDTEILKWLNSFCEAIGKKAWLTAQDNKHDNIESLVNAFILDKPYAGIDITFCIAGKEYVKNGYTNYDLFLPKFTKSGAPFGLTDASGKSKVVTYNESVHIVRKKSGVVTDFVPPTEGALAAASNDFEL